MVRPATYLAIIKDEQMCQFKDSMLACGIEWLEWNVKRVPSSPEVPGGGAYLIQTYYPETTKEIFLHQNIEYKIMYEF